MTANRMRVLIVSDLYTHPHDQGNLQYLYRECLAMRQLGWELDFLYWGNYINANFNEMEKFFGEGHLFFANISNSGYSCQLRGFIRRYLDKRKVTRYISVPYTPDELYYKEIEEKVLLLNELYQYDIVWLEYYLQSRLFEALDSTITKVIHTHDRFTDRQKLFQKRGKVPEFYYLTKKGEKTALSRADIVIAIQEKECQQFKKALKGTKAICLSIGDFITEQDTKKVLDKAYGFLGSANILNVNAVNFFINNYLLEIKKEEPESQFIIAGGVCGEIPDSDRYVKLGCIDDLKGFYDKVRFVVTPMSTGTGLNIKNIEALSYGKPVVTTSTGAKGLDGARKAMKVADSSEGYIGAVLELLQHNEIVQEMSMFAKRFVERYNKRNIEKYKYIEKIVQERNGHRS